MHINNCMDFLFLMLFLQVKHWYADFVLQTYDQTVKKGIYGNLVGISHTVDHLYCSMSVLLLFSIFVHKLTLTAIVILPIVECIAHYHIDYIKVKYGSKDIKTPVFWTQFGLDQLAHQFCYILMAAYIQL
jgi:Protein of unknown function (DUF3307)